MMPSTTTTTRNATPPRQRAKPATMTATTPAIQRSFVCMTHVISVMTRVGSAGHCHDERQKRSGADGDHEARNNRLYN